MENSPTKLIIEHADNKITAELPWDANLDDLLDAFYGLCVAHTYHPISILTHMEDWLRERMDGIEMLKNTDYED